LLHLRLEGPLQDRACPAAHQLLQRQSRLALPQAAAMLRRAHERHPKVAPSRCANDVTAGRMRFVYGLRRRLP
jgi:hypothetical protein